MSFRITGLGEYKTANGDKVTIVRRIDNHPVYDWQGYFTRDGDGELDSWREDGVFDAAWVEGNANNIISYWEEETPATTSLGFKKDDGKPKASLLPLTALMEVTSGFTRAMAPGSKYPEHNFRHGMAWTRPANAGFRHLVAWLNGQDNDSESGDNHLAAAIASLMMVLEMQLTNVGADDRWPKVVEEQKNET